ncbi:glutamate--cysteine ligase catalytic subunit-like, partial [Agrilus planipennis]|uniref:Glutamate--cysteine ligase n=1 Tax=Agrilus planipennis TaxID=224129 RepID=A0A7F5RN11_AGRPL
LALSAASPIFRGFLSDVDCRWNVISASVDCRTEEERGLVPLKNSKFVINKSRYDSIDSYLSEAGEEYNDVPLIYDKEIYNKLRENDIDHQLSQHIAHLFIRDALSLFSEKVHQNDEVDTDHFENIQSTNWQNMRFKPPPPNSTIGWRVEFRPCDVQITDFENAAIVCFIVLLTRVILSYKLNFLIPISKFTKDITIPEDNQYYIKDKNNSNRDVCQLMTINEIINGKEGEFPGMIPLINNYLAGMDVDCDTHCTIQRYLKLIQQRASGDVLTTASWIRKFVLSHPDYKKDSKVTDTINYDLLNQLKQIQSGEVACEELLGYSAVSKTKETIPPVFHV